MKIKEGRRRYDLYLSESADERLIKHLDQFVAARRVNEEMRRMLYLALDGVPVAPVRAQPQPLRAEPRKIDPPTDKPADDVKGKLKRMFGMPGKD